VIRPVDPSLAQEASQQAAATTASKPTEASFAAALNKEVKTAQRIVPPAGETWKPVKGTDKYVEIVSGPRKGQYIDLAKGEHRGDTFTIQQREGKLVRVYGEGATEKVVAHKEPGKDSSDKSHAAKEVKPPKGEMWAPVEGHWNYADILNGKRNGFYVNLSSGARRGQVFVIEKHEGKTYHVYGEGKDRLMVEVRTKTQPANGGTRTGSTQGTSQPTGGSSAASNGD
jgi:hypothetical protein